MSEITVCTPTNRDGDLTKGHLAMLHSVLPDSAYIQWQLNDTYQAQFTAWDDGSEAFSMLQIQNTIKLGGQWFVIKQIQPDYSGGVSTIAVVANHVALDYLNRQRRYNAQSITWIDSGNHTHQATVTDSTDTTTTTTTATPQQVLDAYNMGSGLVKFKLVGSLNAASVDLHQDLSMKGVLDLLRSTWSTIVIQPDNYTVTISSAAEFYQDHGHRTDYLHDTTEVQLSYDTTNLKNGARLVGASQEQDSTSETTTTATTYYFTPFFYQNDASVKRWGLYVGEDITSETVQDATAMKRYADQQFNLNPEFSLQATKKNSGQPIPGDIMRVEIRPVDYVAKLKLVEYQYYPLSKVTPSVLTYNSSAQSILDYNVAQAKVATRIASEASAAITNLKNQYSNLKAATNNSVAKEPEMTTEEVDAVDQYYNAIN